MDNFGPLAQRFLLEHPDWKSSIDSHCPVGWDSILAQALVDLPDLARSRRARISITQIKQKWAQLRVYIQVEGEPTEFVLDMCTAAGVMSMRTKNATPGTVTEKAWAIVDRATEQSCCTCEECGELRVARVGRWHRVLCDQHDAKQQ